MEGELLKDNGGLFLSGFIKVKNWWAVLIKG